MADPDDATQSAIKTLGRGDPRAVHFRLAHDLFVPVAASLDTLYQADIGDSGWDYLQIVRQISLRCLEITLPDSQNSAALHPLIRNHLDGLRLTVDAELQHRHFSAHLNSIASSLRVTSADECLATLEEMNRQGWQLFNEMIEAIGGPRSKARRIALQSSGPATLRARLGDLPFTYCHCLPSEHEIHLMLGTGSPSLSVMFDLPFYFMHEYVSHVFPVWDDERVRFSEAHLLRAAFAFLNDKWRQDAPARAGLLGGHFDALRAQTDPQSASVLRRAEDAFSQLFLQLGRPFLTYLLEWATLPAETDQNVDERGEMLSAFHALAKDPATLRAVFGVDSGTSRPADPFPATAQRLYATAQILINKGISKT
jgi:hypothetical protein